MAERKRVKNIAILFVIILSLVYINIFYIQVIKGEYYLKQANNNGIKLIYYPAIRGRILDRNGEILAEDIPSLNLNFYISSLTKDELNNTLNNLKNLTAEHRLINIQKIKEKINSNRYRLFEPITILEDIKDKQLLAKLLEHKQLLKGVEIQTVPKRHYPGTHLASHVIGYVGKINSNEYKFLKNKEYRFNDRIGKYGIELSCERYLRGIDGYKQVEVDAYSRPVNVFAERVPIPGADVVVTLDKRIQTIVEEIMSDKKGVVIVMQPHTSEILAMTSKPDFSLNNLVSNKENLSELLTNKDNPLLNKAIQALYAPGSIFKIITAAAALQEKIISETDTLNCEGYYKIGNRKFKCFRGYKHGKINITSALAHSCNVFFYQLGIKLGVAKLIKYANKFGLTEQTHINLPYEKQGFIPSPVWKFKKFKTIWYPGETLNLSIGQGYTIVTPIELTMMFSSLITGKLKTPQIIDKIIYYNPNQTTPKIEKVTLPSIIKEKTLDISPDVRRIIMKGLEEGVEYGTGRNAKVNKAFVIGKTGTAQIMKGKDHALFICYATKNLSLPGVVIFILVEHGRSGSTVATPIAKEIIQKCRDILFNDEVKKTI